MGKKMALDGGKVEILMQSLKLAFVMTVQKKVRNNISFKTVCIERC
jgi:hypothetical protein